MAATTTRRTTRSTSKTTPLTRPAKVTKAPPKSATKAKATEKALRLEAAAQRLVAKRNWEAWIQSHTIPEPHRVLEHTLKREDCVTQTDCFNFYHLRPVELAALKYWAEARVVFGHQAKLFVREQVEQLVDVKKRVLAGEIVDGGRTGENWGETQVGETQVVEKSGAPKVGKVVSFAAGVHGSVVGAGGGSVVGDGPVSRSIDNIGPARCTRAQVKAYQLGLEAGL